MLLVIIAAVLLIRLPPFCAAYPSSGGQHGAASIPRRKLGPKHGVKLEAARANVKDTGVEHGAGSSYSKLTVACRSNSTHISWPSAPCDGPYSDTCTYQTFGEAVRGCVRYLRRNLMPFDLPNLATLGFPPETGDENIDETVKGKFIDGQHTAHRQQRAMMTSETSALESLPDGLSDGIVNQTVHLALKMKISYPWTDMLPQGIFYEYVLNFACSNEARTNWRPLLTDAVSPIVDAMITSDTRIEAIRVEDVVKQINQQIWMALGKSKPGTNETKPIKFVSGQTPLIFDPMSIIAFGYASCTGLSILFVFALRAAGVPARLAGTPAWNGNAEHGNHNWVEVWTPLDNSGDAGGLDCGGQWRFLEPASGDFGDNADSIEKDPCKRWFCNKERFDGSTRVYATRYDRTASDGTIYFLAWK